MNRLAELATELEEQRALGLEIVFLASLDPSRRDKLATKEERAAAIAMRKASVMKGRVMTALGCSSTELDRWDVDGRLPHLFTKRIDAGWGKKNDCRFWNAFDVERAKANIEQWRLTDSQSKREKRAKARKLKNSVIETDYTVYDQKLLR